MGNHVSGRLKIKGIEKEDIFIKEKEKYKCWAKVDGETKIIEKERTKYFIDMSKLDKNDNTKIEVGVEKDVILLDNDSRSALSVDMVKVEEKLIEKYKNAEIEWWTDANWNVNKAQRFENGEAVNFIEEEEMMNAEILDNNVICLYYCEEENPLEGFITNVSENNNKNKKRYFREKYVIKEYEEKQYDSKWLYDEKKDNQGVECYDMESSIIGTKKVKKVIKIKEELFGKELEEVLKKNEKNEIMMYYRKAQD